MRGKKAKFLRRLARASIDSDAPIVKYNSVPVKQKFKMERTPLSTINEDQRVALKIDEDFITELHEAQPDSEDPMVTIPVPYMEHTRVLAKDCVRFLYHKIKKGVRYNKKHGLPVPTLT